MRAFSLTVTFFLLVFSVSLRGADGPAVFDLRASAGKHDRRDTPVSVALPEGVRAVRLVETTGGASRDVPAQVESGNPARLHWILAGETSRGTSRTFRGFSLAESPKPSTKGVSIHDEKGKYLELRVNGTRVLRYNYGLVSPPDPKISVIQTRNGYIHPVWTPSGRVVTNDYARGHHHHRGVWFAWVNTEFGNLKPDFWNLGDRKGFVRFQSQGSTVSGPVFGGFRVHHQHIALTPRAREELALNERWDVKVYAVEGQKGGAFLFDLVSVQECARQTPLRLLKHRYGGLGFRGSGEWEGDNVKFLTSEGKTRRDGHRTRCRWCDVSGPVDGEPAGIVIYCHPGNYRSPQNVRIHPSEPFFNFAPVQAGDMELKPGSPYLSRYRFLVHDGEISTAVAEQVWHDYAEPPVVTIQP